ncbi:MAG TPA: T9SS type A sorting domain-containing protein [Chitinophagales bacterium]|nr:T9SS type A sorting domain-containing protein [Chitinophagales bacterium]
MRIAPTIVVCFIFCLTQAQQFSTPITFNNFISYPFNVAGRDTIIIGYDPAASDTLDTSFGETNILGNYYDTVLDVRISNIWGIQNSPAYFGQTPYQTKKQIAPDRCGTNAPSIIELNIKSKYWPVYVYWTRPEFQDSCRNGSSLTNMNPADWWGGQGFREVFAIWNYHPIYPNQWYHIQGNDTIYTYWIGLGDSESVALKIIDMQTDNHGIRVYPNPVIDRFTVEAPGDFNLEYVELYSVDGRLLLKTSDGAVNISNFSRGIYYAHIIGENQQRQILKVLKL